MEKTFNWKRPEIVTVIATLVVGIIVHLFGLVNVLQNYDNIVVQPYGYGIALHSGRWALLLFGQAVRIFFGAHNLPWINGVLFILFIALTAGVVVSVFGIKDSKTASLIGIVFVTFPSAAATLLYKYTAHFDAFALFLAVLAVWFLEKNRYGMIPAVISIALSLGIYQAYIPVTIAMFVLLLIKQILTEDDKVSRVIWRGIYDCISLILGLIVYFICLKVFLARYNASLLPYQGINEMGKISLTQLPMLIKNAFLDGCLFPFNEYGSIAQIGLLKIAYCALWVIIIVMIIYTVIVKKKNLYQGILVTLLGLIFPIAVNFIVIMCPDGWIYTLMVYSFALIPCIPLFFMDAVPKAEKTWEKFRKAFLGLTACTVLVITVSNAYMTNVNYTVSYYATRQAENYIDSIVTQVRLTEGFTPEKKWVAFGSARDPLLDGTWDNIPVYGGNVTAGSLISSVTFEHWIRLYCGYLPEWATEEEKNQLAGNEIVSNMPIWPSEGSIQVVDDYVVIKFESTQ